MKQQIAFVAASSLVVVVSVFAHHGLAATPERALSFASLEPVSSFASSMAKASALPALSSATLAAGQASDSSEEREPHQPLQQGTEIAETSEQAIAELLEQAQRLENLKLSVESSIYGRLDAQAVLDLAESLLESEVDPRANPVPDPTGSMFFPLVDTPAGIEAELKVSHSTVERYANVLGLELMLVGDGEPQYLDGVMREPGVGRVQIWTDHQGRVLDMTIQTLLEPDYQETVGQGLRFDVGQVTRGVLFHYDAASPEDSSMSAYGFIDSVPTTWSVPLQLSQGDVRMEQVQGISDGLLGLYAGLRNQ